MADQPSLAVVLYSLRAEGAPRLTLDLCREWAGKGVPVVVLVLFAQPDDLRAEYKKAGVTVAQLHLEKSRVRIWSLILGVRRECRRHRVSALVCMMFGWHLFAAIGARLGGVKKVLVHVGNRPLPSLSVQWLLFWLMVELARPLTSVLLCCSDYVRKTVTRTFVLRKSETVTVPNGIALDRWRPAERASGSEIHVAMVATLEAHKDQLTLIRAVPELQARAGQLGKSVTLSLAGGGSRQKEFETLIADIGLTNSVRVLGSQQNVPAFLAAADVFAFSTTESEGQGIALVEAMAMGLPICASDVGACREVLASGQCGLLVTPQNPPAMAQGIARLIAEPDLARRLAQAALVRARNVYDIRHTADAYLAQCA